MQPDDTDVLSRRRLLRWLGVFGAVVVLLVTTSSAALRVTEAGLGCEDWPACYGRSKAVAAAHPTLSPVRLLHRLAASAAGAAVLGIGLIALTAPRRFRAELIASGVLAGLAFGLALLGRATPGATLPAVALGNALGGMAMASLLFWIGLGEPVQAERRTPWLRVLSIAALASLFTVIGLGVLTSASFSGLACTGLPLCTDAGFPGEWSAADLDPWRAAAASPSIHMAHRVAALAAAVLIVALAWRLGRLGRAGRRLRTVLLSLLVLQVALGAGLVKLVLPLPFAVGHNLGAAGLLLALIAAHHLLAAGGNRARS